MDDKQKGATSWYYYLHTNGDFIGRNPIVVTDDYFDSPFCKKFWKVDLQDRGQCWEMVLEALALGARPERMKELARKWRLDFKDSTEMLARTIPTDLQRKGLDIFIEKILEMDIDEYWKKSEDHILTWPAKYKDDPE